MNSSNTSVKPHKKNPNERLLLLTLAAVQFTTVLDFLIIMPLGPQYIRVFAITPGQFGLIVSAYAISAGICGLVAGLFLDRFDRKTAMLALYSGFIVGTLSCALSPSYHLLVVSRAIAGAFGGVTGALILAIIGDAIPEERRGAAMGMVMSAFSVASICGVPIGLFLATRFSWHVPFFALAVLSTLILMMTAGIMPSLRSHISRMNDQHPVARLVTVMMHTDHRMAFLFMAALTCTGFLVFPYLSSYMVANVGVTEKQLPLIYLCGGSCTIFSLNWIGRWADRVGKPRVFTLVTLSAMIPILTLTNLPHVPLFAALMISTIFMICMSGRMVPAMSMMTSSVEARYRGGFMSINSAVQQFTAGTAAYLSGHIMGQTPQGAMTHFSIVGILSVTCAFTSIFLARFLKYPEDQVITGDLAVVEG